MSDHVVTVYVSANVAGESLHIHEASLVLGVNQIPRIELMVAPTNDSGSTPLKPKVLTPTISDFSDIYRNLANKAPGLNTKGSVHIDVYEDGEPKDSIDLRDWVLSGVGLSSVSATSAPYMTVILQHPICYLTKLGSIYEEPMCDMRKMVSGSTIGKKNLMEVITAVYECARNARYYPSLENIAKVFRKKLGLDVFDPNRYLDEDCSSHFLEKSLNAGKNILAAATGRFVLPTQGGSSTWDMLLSTAGLLLLSIVQDETRNFTTNKLLLEPTKPWKSPTIQLDDEDCSQTDLPGMDSFKLIGVYTRKPSHFSDIYTLGMRNNGNANRTDTISNLFYSPFEKVEDADGRIMATSCPDVLAEALMEDAATGKTLTLSNIDTKEARASGLRGALIKYCQAVYEITTASMNTATAKMILMFRDRNNKLILPGNTCRFISKGKDIYYGYARQVVHYLSTRGGCCTTIQMSYVRPDEKYKIMDKEVIKDGDKNPAYD